MMKKNTPLKAKTMNARDRILIAAHDLFYQLGFRATGVDLIIATAKVTKTTFYRHFSSKHLLIIAFLNYRHEKWITWFKTTLQTNGNNIHALCPTLEVWFTSKEFRGCAFINSVSEFAEELPEVAEISKQHKLDMNDIVETLLPNALSTTDAKSIAATIGLAIDGTIIQTQYDKTSLQPLTHLQHIIDALVK